MNEQFDSEAGPLRPRQNPESRGTSSRRAGDEPRAKPSANGHAVKPDMWTFADILAHRWHWLVIGCILGMGGLLALGILYIQPKFTAVVQLMRDRKSVV